MQSPNTNKCVGNVEVGMAKPVKARTISTSEKASHFFHAVFIEGLTFPSPQIISYRDQS